MGDVFLDLPSPPLPFPWKNAHDIRARPSNGRLASPSTQNPRMGGGGGTTKRAWGLEWAGEEVGVVGRRGHSGWQPSLQSPLPFFRGATETFMVVEQGRGGGSLVRSSPPKRPTPPPCQTRC